MTPGNMKYVRVTDLSGRIVLEKQIDEPFFYRVKTQNLKFGSYYLVSVDKNTGRSTGVISFFL